MGLIHYPYLYTTVKSIKTIVVAIVVFAAFSVGMITSSTPGEKPKSGEKIAPHKINRPIGMSDKNQF